MTWWYHDWWLYITDDNIWKIMFDDYLKKMTWWLSEYILNDNIRFMNGKVVWKKNHVGNPMSYTTTSWEKMLTTSYNPLIATLGMISWEKKKAGKPVNPLVHWWSFSQGLVYFRAVPVQQPPEKQKKCRKVFIPCPKYCQINCSNLFGVTVITHGLKSCLVWKKTKTTLIIQWRRPNQAKWWESPMVESQKLENVHVWNVANTRVPTILTQNKTAESSTWHHVHQPVRVLGMV